MSILNTKALCSLYVNTYNLSFNTVEPSAKIELSNLYICFAFPVFKLTSLYMQDFPYNPPVSYKILL